MPSWPFLRWLPQEGSGRLAGGEETCLIDLKANSQRHHHGEDHDFELFVFPSNAILSAMTVMKDADYNSMEMIFELLMMIPRD